MKFGLKHALNGVLLMFKSERNFRIQFSFFIVAIALGAIFNISSIEWIAVLLCSGLVLSLEMVNSAIEKTCNRITTNQEGTIQWIKDVTAGAVLIVSVISLIVGVLIFAPYFYLLLP